MGKAAKFLYLLSGRLVPLLDEYSGAAAAYSLRSLSTSTTDVVKVRRSGDDAELDFTASEVSDGTLAAWVVAGGGTEDGFVTTWYDQSGNANNATQATAANQPQIVSSGTLVTENGKAAVDFDGAGSYLDSASISVSLPMSYFLIGRELSTAATDLVLLDAPVASATDPRGIVTFSTSNTLKIFDGSVTTVSAGTDSQFLATLIAATSSPFQTTFFNGTAGGTDTSTIGRNLDGLRVGARNDLVAGTFFEGIMQEVIIYPSDQSANRTGIEANINAHYNIYS